MASARPYNGQHRHNKHGRINAPFNFQIPSSLRDPQDATLSSDQLARMRSDDDARQLALELLHDPEQFALLWKSTKVHPETRRLMRKLVQIQTINAVFKCFYRLSDKTKVQLNKDAMFEAALHTRPYVNEYEYDADRQARIYDRRAEVFVVDGDCLDVALHFKHTYPDLNPVVLNMASANNPGGGWRNGAGAQEENLHRRTNMFQCLEDPYRELDGQRDWSYHVPEFGGIYSPKVSVFRGSESDGYPFFPNGPEYLSFIACAAYSHPPTETKSDGQLELSGKRIIQNMKDKIEAILKIALENQHDTVILSALGCGAYQNPPRHVARLFREVIHQKYPRSFRILVFAIINDHNAMKSHNPTGNIQPFADVFSVPILTVDTLPSSPQQSEPMQSSPQQSEPMKSSPQEEIV